MMEKWLLPFPITWPAKPLQQEITCASKSMMPTRGQSWIFFFHWRSKANRSAFKSLFFYWSIVDLQCSVNSAAQQNDCHTHMSTLFKYSFPWWFIIGYWIQFSVLCIKALLIIPSMFHSSHLLPPASHSILRPDPSPLAPPSLFSQIGQFWPQSSSTFHGAYGERKGERLAVLMATQCSSIFFLFKIS